MKQEQVASAAADLGVPLTSTQVAQLGSFALLLSDRGAAQGLIASGDRVRIWERHLLDSLRCAAVLGPDSKTAADLGSGGGLPGIPLAIAAPQVAVSLIERRRSRAAFLELAVDELGLSNATVFAGGTEHFEGPAVDACTARAFASAEESWKIARPLLVPGGRLIYFGGKGFGEPRGLEGMAGCEVRAFPMLESSGPLVIMTRK